VEAFGDLRVHRRHSVRLEGRLLGEAFVLGPVWRCDQPVAFGRSLIQIIEARRWRPAR
jgi:hypothetical protein